MQSGRSSLQRLATRTKDLQRETLFFVLLNMDGANFGGCRMVESNWKRTCVNRSFVAPARWSSASAEGQHGVE